MPWFTVLVIAVLVVGGFAGLKVFGVFDGATDVASGPQIDLSRVSISGEVGQRQQDQGREHIADGQRFGQYNSTPPTSGPHWPRWAADGVYDTAQPDEFLMHNLEHGYVVISYNQIAPTDLSALKALRSRIPADRFSRKKIIIRPYERIPAGSIALTAWTWLDSMQGYDEQRILRFVVAHRNQGPEGETAP